MMNHLKKAGIGTGIHYPIPLHLQKAYASLSIAREISRWRKKPRRRLSPCPCFRSLTAEQQARVVDEILSFTASSTRRPAEAEVASLAAADRTA